MKDSKSLRPPKQLKATGRAFWKLVQETFAIADHQQPLVTVAAELLDRADECRRIIDDEGVTVVDRFGQTKSHPLLPSERDARNAFLLACSRLGIDARPPEDAPEVRW